MQQQNSLRYSFSETGKEKKYKPGRRSQERKKPISYIETKYGEKNDPVEREESDKDIVF